LLFNFALVYDIKRVQVIRDGLKLNGTHQGEFMLMIILWVEVCILQRKRAEALVVASKETGQEVNVDKNTVTPRLTSDPAKEHFC
jgi:hypothetical protein